MGDIYQQIWDADQSENGIVPILDTEQGDPNIGFVKVNSNLDMDSPDLKVLPEAVIPESKKRTYDLCRVLFDNYALRERDEEFDTPEEREEVHNFVDTIIDTAPMQVAKEYLVQATGTSITRERWYSTVLEMWFRKFQQGGDPQLTGFEHVVVGEQEEGKVQGYHNWYKYYLDDGFARQVDGIHADTFPGLTDDRILYLGSHLTNGQKQFPESVTISYKWMAADYDRDALRPLTKPKGGFFVGCSVEGLLAIGTVRAHLGARAPKKAVINGAKYDLKLFHGPERRSVRTFYPMFKGAQSETVDDIQLNPPIEIVTSKVRMVAALVNPSGHDPGHESITLFNTGTTPVSLTGWQITNQNAQSTNLDGYIDSGMPLRINLDGSGVQLSNRGGTIRLLNESGKVTHSVSYSKSQVRTQGETILF
ncbi:hypothetical protein [uncultured Gimesia sp.]|uniref:hypothetical protein n=1 Tax=uncultured Gimesia sp. TaxID=1678688 RepID=UPI0030D75D46